MVKSLAVAFGMMTALAVAGSMTPAGQGMLGQRHPAEQAVPVSTIQDRPAAVPAPAQSFVSAPVATAPKVAPVPATRHPQAVPVVSRPSAGAVPRAGRPPVVQPAQPQSAPGGIAGIANILLNLPQVLDQTHPARPHGRHHAQDQKKRAPKDEAGDNGSGN